jgi:hypothetical protein
LLGNEGNDWIKGGSGDDHLIGDNGNPFGEPLPDVDTAAFAGDSRNYSVEHNDDGTMTVTDNVGTDGSDTLENIERLQFSDRTVLTDDGLNFEKHTDPRTHSAFDGMSSHSRSNDFHDIVAQSLGENPVINSADADGSGDWALSDDTGFHRAKSHHFHSEDKILG